MLRLKPKKKSRLFKDATSRFCAFEMASSYDDWTTAVQNYSFFGTRVYCTKAEFYAARQAILRRKSNRIEIIGTANEKTYSVNCKSDPRHTLIP